MMSGPTLVVFIRHPQPGLAKTRLIPALGTHGAAILQHRMTLHTLAVARRLAASHQVAIQLHVSGDLSAVTELYGNGPWALVPQHHADLGARLIAAGTKAFEAGGPVVIIGTDCPGLTCEHLAGAFSAMRDADVAIGPATDGGYYLIGMRRFNANLFYGIDWSTSRVAAQTRTAAAAVGLDIAELPPLGDVDLPEDLPLTTATYAATCVALTGATGALGTHFLSRLLHQSPATRAIALVRPGVRSVAYQQLLTQFREQITELPCDLTAFDLTPSQRQSLAEADDFWHFAGSTNMHGRDSQEVAWRVNDGGTRTVVDALMSLPRPPRLFHISTAYVCGENIGTVCEDDGSPRDFRNSYEASKFAAEHHVRAALSAGLRGCILRPSVVVEDAPAAESAFKIIDLVGAAVLTASRTGEPLVLRLPRDAGINAVHADWLYEAMTTLAARPTVDHHTYHLTARRPLRVADIAELCAAEQSSWSVVLDPALSPRELPLTSRLLDRALAPFVPYLIADVQFDRSHFEAAAPDLARLPELDPLAVLRYRRRLEQSTTPPIAMHAGVR
ncbi:MAG TPA: TIGR04282 family arsenosugar biosynthesis glycosyltransferase [Tepidisphaeraceae bacterium]|jgi:hypothetical protein|nr:TIGR04282 family arsenosugar biosynthesis glycosyltransferase [Tepidisphaeraceae bacterium]